MKRISLSIAFFSLVFSLNAQSAGSLIGENSSNTPDASAELEVASDDKGILIPTLTTAQRDAISGSNIPEGLLIYNLTTNKYNYRVGNVWIEFPTPSVNYLVDADADTKLRVSDSQFSDEDKIFFELPKGTSVLDKDGLDIISSSKTAGLYIENSCIAWQNVDNLILGQSDTSKFNSSRSGNVHIGNNISFDDDTDNNTMIGNNIAYWGSQNTIVGNDINAEQPISSENVLITRNTNFADGDIKNNVIIGNNQTFELTGQGNIIIGNQNNKTINASGSVMIGNNIASDMNYGVNIADLITTEGGKVSFGGKYTFPDSCGFSGQTLVLDSDSKNLVWQSLLGTSTGTLTGAAANMYTFDIVARDGDFNWKTKVIFVPIVPYSDAIINKITTYVKAGDDNYSIKMALYDESGQKIATTEGSFNVPNGYITLDWTSVDGNPINVQKGKTYWVGMINNGKKDLFAKNGRGFKYMAEVGCPWENDCFKEYFDEGLPNNIVSDIPEKREIKSYDVQIPWLRLY